MCGRFTLTTVPEEIARAFGVPFQIADYSRRYNIAPSQSVIALLHSHGRSGFEKLRWGLIPFWAKDPGMGNRMINARSETLLGKKSFKGPFLKSRCLIAADGFYEWRKQGSQKIPHYIFLKDRRPFGFAGLWSTWRSPEGEAIRSCTLITTEANSKVKPIHDRMPVILKESDHKEWMDPDNQDPDLLKSMLQPFDENAMDYHEVSTWVNSPGHEGERCTEQILR